MSNVIYLDPFDPDSVKNALAELKKYEKRLAEKRNKFIELLKREGLSELNVLWNSALYDGLDVTQTRVVDIPNGFELEVNGNAVCFIEFGAGVYYNSANPYPGTRPPEVGDIGTYGKLNGQKPYWFYTGQPGNAGGELADGHRNSTITHGNPANAPLWKTAQYLRNRLNELAKEAFE